MAVLSPRRTAATLLAFLLFVLGLAVVAPAVQQTALGQATPTCPTGSTLDPATGQCEQPATATCPAGTADIAGTCTATLDCGLRSGLAGRILGNPIGGTVALCDHSLGGQSTHTCPATTTVTAFTTGTVGLGPTGTITCTTPATLACPAGFTLSGATCLAAGTCPPGSNLTGGVCEAPPAPPAPAFTGFALAIGAGAGSTGPAEREPDDDLWCPGDQVPLLDDNGDVVLDNHGFTECVAAGGNAGPPSTSDAFEADGFA